MPRDLSLGDGALAALNAQPAGDAEAILRAALSGGAVPGPVALVSSFGADSAVLLHMVSTLAPQTPVLFIDTLMLFPETLEYQRELAQVLGLRDLRVIRPREEALFARDPDGVLHLGDPDACCALRKTEVLDRALEGFAGWITGRKRFQAATRATLPAFERDGARIKVNPLADWDARALDAYLTRHALPRHPLVARGYPSIGCAPCTGPAAPDEDPRAGRWRGRDKIECGIHVRDGRVVRGPAA